MGSIPGLGRSLERNDNPLQYSCLGNPKDGGAWQATVHRVAKELDTTYQLNNNDTVGCHAVISQAWVRYFLHPGVEINPCSEMIQGDAVDGAGVSP